MIASAVSHNEVFAGNRAVGRINFAAAATGGISRRTRVHEAGALRLRFPNAIIPGMLDAVVVNTAGGMTGGDQFNVDVDIGASARVSVTTAAAEKIYRSLGPDTKITVKLTIGRGALLAWLPRETILFDQMRLDRTIDVTLAREAQLLLAEAVVFGRCAMGETVGAGRFCDCWRVRYDGKLVFAETSRLDGEIAQQLGYRAAAGRNVAIATMIQVPGTDSSIVPIRAMHRRFAGEVGASAWNGLAVVRFVAPDGAALRHDLAIVAVALGGVLPRLWLT
jgi:urease accessory protein